MTNAATGPGVVACNACKLVAVAVLLVLCLGVTATAHAAPTQVEVRIEGRTQTLFEGPILTEGHDVSSFKADGGNGAEDVAEHPCDGINALDPENTMPGPTSTAASVDAMSVIGETQAMAGQWYPGFNDYFVKQWGSEAENAEAEGKSWGILVNDVFTNVGGCQHELGTGDEALWVYNAFEFRPFLALFAVAAHYTDGERPLTATATLDEPFQVEVLAYTDDTEDTPPPHSERTGTEPFADALIAPVSMTAKGFEKVELSSPETVTTNKEGKASITFTTPGWHRLKAGGPIDPETGEEEAIRSNRLDVCVSRSGESGCGEPPAEDLLRVPARYVTTPEAEHKSETPSTTGGPQPGTGSARTTTGTGQTLAASASHPAAKLTAKILGGRRLSLSVPGPGTITIKLARRQRAGHRLLWHLVKTLEVKATRIGVLTIALPRLAPGDYRASITLAGGAPVFQTFLTPRRR